MEVLIKFNLLEIILWLLHLNKNQDGMILKKQRNYFQTIYKYILILIQGSATDISLQDAKLWSNIYNVSTIKGIIYMYDCRNPLK